MGYSCTSKPASVSQYLARNFSHENENAKYEFLRGAFAGLTYYCAVRRTDKQTGRVIIFAGVTLVRYSKGPYGFCHKDMTEDMGPCEAKCPGSILDLLTEPENENAAAWRAKCRKYRADRSTPVDPAALAAWAKDNGARNFENYSAPMRKRWANAFRRHTAAA